MVVDIVIASLFHQFSLYVCVRLARRGFTLGELSVVALFSSALFMEVVNLTRAKVSQSASSILNHQSFDGRTFSHRSTSVSSTS